MIVSLNGVDGNNDEFMPIKIILIYASIHPHKMILFNDGLDMRMYLKTKTVTFPFLTEFISRSTYGLEIEC